VKGRDKCKFVRIYGEKKGDPDAMGTESTISDTHGIVDEEVIDRKNDE
jgi:hypothetical protein